MIDTIIMIAIVIIFNLQMINFVSIMNNSFTLADKLFALNNAGKNRFSVDYQTSNSILN
jgi:hypothetical protein